MDLVDRLEHFACFFSPDIAAEPYISKKPCVKVGVGLAIPNSPDPKTDRTTAKINYCSPEALAAHSKWGRMNNHNLQVMKEKTDGGQYVRNLGMSSEEAKKNLQRSGRACLQKFYSHSKIGSSVFLYNPKLPQQAPAAPTAPPKQPAATHGPFYAAAVTGPPLKWTPKPAISRSVPEESTQVATETKVTAEPAQQPFHSRGLPKSSTSIPPSQSLPSIPAVPASSCNSDSSQTATSSLLRHLAPARTVLTAALSLQSLQANAFQKLQKFPRQFRLQQSQLLAQQLPPPQPQLQPPPLPHLESRLNKPKKTSFWQGR